MNVVARNKLSNYLHDFLACNSYKDYAPNGLQIEGKSEIRKICSAVSASNESIEQAIAFNADALLVHHGYFWRGEDPAIVSIKRARIAKILKHDINLFAFHLPLDCHLELGNNVLLGQDFNFVELKSYTANECMNLLWLGNTSTSLTLEELAQLAQQKLQRKPDLVVGCKQKINKVAWSTGAAQDLIAHAKDIGADAFISGEISERTYYLAKELKINYLSCGHHATERYGVKALGTHLSRKFGLEHVFLDSGNFV